MLPIVSLNGQLLDQTTTVLSVFDRGFLLGDGIFETLRASDGTPWYLDRHLRRLRAAAQRTGHVIPSQLDAWIHATMEHTVQQGHRGDSALRITVTRGGTTPQPLSGMQSTRDDGTNSTVVITVTDLPNVLPAVYERGLTAQIAAGIRNDRGILTGIKTTSYIESIVALRDAHQGGFDDAIFLDTYGFVSEATASNVFVVIEGVIVTPAPTHGILPGITRAVVLEIARQLEIPTAERELRYQELLNASEAFLTSSLRGLAPLVRVNDVVLGRGVPDAVTHRLMAAYAAHTPRI